MNRFLVWSAATLLVSCSPDASAPSGNRASSDHSVPAAKNPEGTARSVAMSLLNTTWEIADDKAPMVISVDEAGGYIEELSDGTHVDHGTYAHRDGKDCFTSGMGDRGINCWTAVPEVEIGASASATDDDGNRSFFKRVNYRALKPPG